MPPESGKVKIDLGPLCIESAMPKWAVTSVSVLALLISASGGAYATYLKLSAMHQESMQKQAEQNQIVLEQQAKKMNRMLVPIDQMEVLDEQNKHQGDDEPTEQK